jgi:hypothetical protein
MSDKEGTYFFLAVLGIVLTVILGIGLFATMKLLKEEQEINRIQELMITRLERRLDTTQENMARQALQMRQNRRTHGSEYHLIVVSVDGEVVHEYKVLRNAR